MDQRKIGAFIAQLRKEKGLTQEQLAESLNVSNKSVSRWETGNGLPDIAVMGEMCKFFNISMDELVNGERITAPPKKKGAMIIIIVAIILILAIVLCILIPKKKPEQGSVASFTPSFAPSFTPSNTLPATPYFEMTLTPILKNNTASPDSVTETPSETTIMAEVTATATMTPEVIYVPGNQSVIVITPKPTNVLTPTPELTATLTPKPTSTPTPTPKPTPTPTPTSQPLETPNYTHVLSGGRTLTFSNPNDITNTFVQRSNYNYRWENAGVGNRYDGNYDIVTDEGESVMQYASNAAWKAPILLPSITRAIFSQGSGTYVLEFDVKITATPNGNVGSFMTLAFFYKEKDPNIWDGSKYKSVLKNVYDPKGNTAIASKCLNVNLSDAQIGQWYHCKCEFVFTDELENIMRTTDMFFGSYSTGYQGVIYLFDNLSIRKK